MRQVPTRRPERLSNHALVGGARRPAPGATRGGRGPGNAVSELLVPALCFVRSSGWAPADAEDLTQEFFARLLEKNYLRVVEPEKGRFRTFLRFALKRFLAKEWERRGAAKRGGGQGPIAFDAALAEERFATEGAGTLSPEQLYDRQWALSLLNEALTRLALEYEAAGKTASLPCSDLI